MMAQKLLIQQNSVQVSELRGLTTESLINSMGEFHFDPDTGVTFESWFRSYEDILQVVFPHHDDSSKVRSAHHKPGVAEHKKYSNLILPKHPTIFLLILLYKHQREFLLIKLFYLVCDIIVLGLLRDLKMTLFHIQHLLISNSRVLSCVHFHASIYRLMLMIVLSLYGWTLHPVLLWFLPKLGRSSTHPTNDCIKNASGILIKCTDKFNDLVIEFKCHVTDETFNLLDLD